jgi:NADH dehydrogenase FAD-containing subunit
VAGGLSLATQLGKSWGQAEVTLVDGAHVWKPLLHQLAAGSFDSTRRRSRPGASTLEPLRSRTFDGVDRTKTP